MPSASGLEALERLKKRGVTSKFVILTMHREASIAAQGHARRRVRVSPEGVGRGGTA